MASSNSVMLPASYQVSIINPRTGQTSAVFRQDAFRQLRYSRVLNGVGRLAFTLDYADASAGTYNDVFVLDTTSAEGVLSAPELRPTTDPGANRSWGFVGYLIDGSPLLRTHCYGTNEDCPGRTVLGVLDADGVVHETITIPGDAQQVTLDASGSWVLYVRFQNADSGRLEQLPLAEGARAEDLGEGARFAAFLPSTQRDRR